MGILLQVLEIIFEVQMKMSNEKVSFPTYKTRVFLLWTPLTFKPHNFFIIHFKWFKVLYEHQLKFYKLSLNCDNNKATYKEFYGCLGTSLCSIWWFISWVLDPSILRGHNFFNFILFLTICSALDVPIKGFQVLLRCQKQWSPPLGYGVEHLNAIIETQLQLMNN
jgi:hypothetical protein